MVSLPILTLHPQSFILKICIISQKQQAIKDQDFEKAAKFRDQERETKAEFEKMSQTWKKKKIETRMMKGVQWK